MYGYLNKTEFTKLVINKRSAIVINNKSLKDLDEYLINLKIYLDNSGVNTSIFNIPKVIKNKAKNTYTIFFIVRHSKDKECEREFKRALQLVKNIEPNSTDLRSVCGINTRRDIYE